MCEPRENSAGCIPPEGGLGLPGGRSGWSGSPFRLSPPSNSPDPVAHRTPDGQRGPRAPVSWYNRVCPIFNSPGPGTSYLSCETRPPRALRVSVVRPVRFMGFLTTSTGPLAQGPHWSVRHPLSTRKDDPQARGPRENCFPEPCPGEGPVVPYLSAPVSPHSPRAPLTRGGQCHRPGVSSSESY